MRFRQLIEKSTTGFRHQINASAHSRSFFTQSIGRSSIVISGGNDNHDPAPTALIRKTTEDLRKKNIPIYYCGEEPADGPGLKPEILQLQKKIEATLIIQQLIMSGMKVEDLPLQYRPDAIELLRSGPATIERHQLYSSLLANNIPTAFIDASVAINQVFQNNFHNKNVNGMDLIALYEGLRIQAMAKNICSKPLESISKTGGIILCQVGALHVPFLASYLNHMLQGREEVGLFPMICRSPRSGDKQQLMSYITELTSKVKIDGLAPTPIDKIYLAEVTEVSTSKFHSATYNEVLQRAITHSQGASKVSQASR
jgi:hypothetical protein